jgi:fimbrial chaperone protein
MLTLPKRTIAALAALAFFAAPAAPASAGQFDVKPIRITLSRGALSDTLTIENQSPSPLRLQIGGYAWTSDANGGVRLAPTDDLIVFPTLVTILPMEHRNVRIGFGGTPGQREQTYRITLDELPSLESELGPQERQGLVVRTRVTVPVFFAPESPVQKAAIAALRISRGAVHATFENTGNVHTIVQDVGIIARDASGRKVYAGAIKGWYVLAGQSRDFVATVPRSQCAKVRSIAVSLSSDAGNFSRTEAVDGCGR